MANTIARSNKIRFLGLRSSKDYYKCPCGVVGVHEKGHVGVIFLRGSMFSEGVGYRRTWVVLVFWGARAASGRPGVS